MKTNSVDGINYDGVFFFPAVDDDGDDVMTFNFWSYDGKYANKESVDATDIGNKFYVAFFKEGENGYEIDDTFEAIFADPKVYLEGLIGSSLFGVVCRKTANSATWFQNYLKETMSKFKTVNEKSLKQQS